jgi:Uma2 family endonuclease
MRGRADPTPIGRRDPRAGLHEPDYTGRVDTVLAETWTTDRFLAWEDRQEGKHEFNGRDVVAMTGGSVAHQRIVFNLCLSLMGLLAERRLTALHEMRIRMGVAVRYPDVVVCESPLDQATRTLTDAVAIFEVLSDDTATTDRVDKLIEYAALPSLRCYVLLEQTAVAATLFQREPNGAWIASAHTGGVLLLPGPDIQMPMSDLYRGLTFPA